jgi:RNA exonuclease NGL2
MPLNTCDGRASLLEVILPRDSLKPISARFADFNLAPDDPTYSLMVGDQLLSAQEDQLALSRVIHTSIDPSILPSVSEGDHDSNVNSDRDIINARPARPTDGLLSTSELITLFASRPALRSVYDDAQRQYQAPEVDVERFGDRVAIQSGRRGAYEPRWTSYTHYWKTVLGTYHPVELSEPK